MKLEEVSEEAVVEFFLIEKVEIRIITINPLDQSGNKFNTKKLITSPEHIQWPKEMTNKAWVEHKKAGGCKITWY